ncbi:MAG: cation diffusion facilitator family transporter [Acidimicrobiia bacterium]
MEEGSRRAIVAALVANLGITIAKFAAAIITGSASMLAESIHSMADTGNQGLLFLGGRRSRRPADTAHPFGYGAERYFWAFVVALVLFTLGALFSLYEGIDKLTNPHQLESPAVAFVVLGIAIVLESLSLRTAMRESRARKGDLGWLQFIRRTKSPELSVVLLEDTGALAGLGFASVGLLLAVVTGETRYDAIGSIAIGALLAVIAVVLAVEMKSLLIGESAGARTRAALEAAMLDAPEVRSIIHTRTLQLGPEDLLVAAKLDFYAGTTTELAPAIDAVEARIRSAVPEARLIYLEPDLDRSRVGTD